MIADRVASGEVKVEHCPAERMWMDMLNKPKQGTPYWVFRGALMNVPVLYDDEKERLETNPALLVR